MSWQFLGLIFGGIIVGVISVAIGGGMFFSIPLIQTLAPSAPLGVIVGNIKVGSFFRSIGSTVSTRRQIEYWQCFKTASIAFSGTIIGAVTIAHLDQRWLFPAVVIAVTFAILAPKIAPLVTNRTFAVVSFVTGLYAGVFGAGLGVILVALLRLKHTRDTDIAFVKIQARFVEFLLTIVAVITHMFTGNLLAALWIPWSIGSIIGGYAGGHILQKIGRLPGRAQEYMLYTVFAIDITLAGIKFFKG